MHKKYFSLILFSCLTILSFGQKEKNNSISGKIIEPNTQAPIEYATIALFSAKDSTLKDGITSDAKGTFALSGIADGNYYLIISFLGFTDVKVNITLPAEGKNHLNLGSIKIGESEKVLDELVISAEKNLVQYGVDKKIYNVDKDLNNAGGSATDVLSNIPSVQVDADRNLSFRGSSNLTILIDGKPSNLAGSGSALDQIPAASIERIEVISNPSAKYDADGTGGIINIITKKGSKKGYYGNVSINAGTGDKYNANLGLNYGFNKSNLAFTYGWQQRNNWSHGESFRSTSFDTSVNDLKQLTKGYDKSQSHNLKLAYDYQLNAQNNLMASFGYNLRDRIGTDNVNYLFLDQYQNNDSNSIRNNYETDLNKTYEGYLGWRKSFKKPGRLWSTEINWSQGEEFETLEARENYYGGQLPVSRPEQRQNTRNPQLSYVGTFQSDYTHQVDSAGKKGKFETGLKTIIRQIDSDFSSEFYDNGNESFVNDTFRSNRYVYSEQVHAVYGTYTNKKGKWGYSGGLRLEQTYYTAHQITQNLKTENDYFSVFPSAYLTYQLKKGNELQASYSRRINRPGFRNLNPFPEYDDPYNLRMGNPLLKPEYINSYELNYVRTAKKATFSITAYLKETFGNITRFRKITNEGVTITSFENLNNTRAWGFEFVTNLDLFRWWKVNLNGNLYRNEMNAGNISSGLSATAWGGMARIMNNFKFAKSWDAQLSYNYYQPGWALQGRIDPFQAMDVAVRKEMWKGKGSLQLRLSDAFNTRQFYIDSYGAGFEQTYLRKRESRVLTLTFSYRFGNDTFNKKSKRGGGGEQQEMMDDF